MLSSVSFYPADLLFKNDSISVAYAHGTLFEVTESDSIYSGALVIRLPDYFSGGNIENNITGYLALILPEKLKNDFGMIKERLQIDHILYLP